MATSLISLGSSRTHFLSCLLKQNSSGRKSVHRVADQACTALLYARECARMFRGRESGGGGWADGRHRGLVTQRRRRRGRGWRLGDGRGRPRTLARWEGVGSRRGTEWWCVMLVTDQFTAAGPLSNRSKSSKRDCSLD